MGFGGYYNGGVTNHPKMRLWAPLASDDPRITARPKRGSNYEAGRFVQEKVNFQTKHGSIQGQWRDDMWGRLRYCVFSYGEHHPMRVWDEDSRTWFHNTHTYSVTTSQHMSQTSPREPEVPMTDADIGVLARHGMAHLLATKRPLLCGSDDPALLYERAKPLLDDPRLPDMVRAPLGPDGLDIGIGGKLEEQARIAHEALTVNLGWVPLMLGRWTYTYDYSVDPPRKIPHEEHPYSKTRELLRLTEPCNAHRKILFDPTWHPVAGRKGGLPALKFFNTKSGPKEPDMHPVWIAFDTMREAKEAERTCRTMRKIHLANEAREED